MIFMGVSACFAAQSVLSALRYRFGTAHKPNGFAPSTSRSCKHAY
jgi:hypothetical protein